MALRATQLLLERISAEDDPEGAERLSRIEVFDAPLVVRGTTAPPASPRQAHLKPTAESKSI
jgi:DNA-binding LacI/PurR family transcriptional regulator